MEDIVPTKFEIAQNYPNPFREKTTIKYCVPDRMKIRLEVFDSKGNKIKTLVDEIKEAGTYKVDFYANGLQMNDYYYKMQTGSFIDTKKMILHK